MSLVKWNNSRLFPSTSSLINTFFEDDFFTRSSDATLIPAVNVKESDSAFTVEVAAPGYDKDDFKVKVENGCLKINSEQKSDTEEKDENFTRMEFSYKSFNRSFTLPENVNADEIKANYEKGILSLELPKLEIESKKDSKFIEIS